MKPYPNEELERMSKREIIRLYKRTVEQFNDAVPVIRCRDCKNAKCIHEEDDWWECSEGHRVVHGNGFCSWAERKEE